MDAVIFVCIVSLIVVIIVLLLSGSKKIKKVDKPIASKFKDKENHSLKDALKYMKFVPFSAEDNNMQRYGGKTMGCNDKKQFSENILNLYNQRKDGNNQYEEHLKHEEKRTAKARDIIENLIFPTMEEVIYMNDYPVLPKAHFYTSLLCDFFCGYSETDYWPINSSFYSKFNSAFGYVSKDSLEIASYYLDKAMELAHEYGLTAVKQNRCDSMRLGEYHYCFYLLA